MAWYGTMQQLLSISLLFTFFILYYYIHTASVATYCIRVAFTIARLNFEDLVSALDSDLTLT
jgi:hypothetical protein